MSHHSDHTTQSLLASVLERVSFHSHTHDPPTSNDIPTAMPYHSDENRTRFGGFNPFTRAKNDDDTAADSIMDALTITLFVLFFTLLYPTLRVGHVHRALVKYLSWAQRVLLFMWLYLLSIGLCLWVVIGQPNMHHTLRDFCIALGISANVYLVLNFMVWCYYALSSYLRCCTGDLELGQPLSSRTSRLRREISTIEVPIPSYDDVILAEQGVKTPTGDMTSPPTYDEAISKDLNGAAAATTVTTTSDLPEGGAKKLEGKPAIHTV